MKSESEIKRLAKKIVIEPNAAVDDRILASAEVILEKAQARELVVSGPNIWRTIMKSRITKLAAAAVIIIAVLVPVVMSVRWKNVPGKEATVKGPKSIVANSGWNFPPLAARVARARLIVRGIIETVGATTNLQRGMDHARIQFQVKKVIVGELTSGVITVDVPVPPGDSAETRYPVEQEVIWFLRPLKTDGGMIYLHQGGPDPGGLGQQEKAIQEALSHPAPSQDPSHW